MAGFTTELQDGRKVVFARGTKTQTVNVCTPDNRAGEYERVYRFSTEEQVEETDVSERADVADVREWAVSHNGVAEDPVGRVGRAVLPLVDLEDDPDWVADATRAVESVLNDAVAEFLARPNLHRVEHSLHAELYRALKEQPVLRDQYRLASGEVTQLVHKEWPETYPDLSVGASGKRGAFDLAVVSPRRLAASTLAQFRQGRIAASIVVEVGLNYGLKHLTGDGEKLVNSAVDGAYLLHFSGVREPNAAAIEAYAASPLGHVRVAYVHHSPSGGSRYKRLDDVVVLSA